MRFPSFSVKTALIFTVSLNLLLKLRFLLQMRIPPFSVKTALVITVSLNLLPKQILLRKLANLTKKWSNHTHGQILLRKWANHPVKWECLTRTLTLTFWYEVRFPSFSVTIGLVISVTLNLSPKQILLRKWANLTKKLGKSYTWANHPVKWACLTWTLTLTFCAFSIIFC